MSVRSLSTWRRCKAPVEVHGWGQQPRSGATEQTRWQTELELRASNTPSDVLRLTPGLTIGQHHRGGNGAEIWFDGFDSNHGTDFVVLHRILKYVWKLFLFFAPLQKLANKK